MLEKVFRYPQVRERIRGNPHSATLEEFTAYLNGRGYALSVTRKYVYAAEHFGQWLGRRSITPKAAEAFVTQHLPACCCDVPGERHQQRVRKSLNRLLEMMGLSARKPEKASSISILLQRYADHMTRVQGLAFSTISSRIRYARDMMASLRIRHARQLSRLSAAEITRYMTRQGRRYSPGTGQLIASSIRSFLRYLLFSKLIHRDLSASVPEFANWRLASLPATLNAAELEKLVNIVDTTSSIGLRDRAVLLCLIDLGMSASEVRSLELGGVDLPAQVLHLRCRKQRRTTMLPMTKRLATAISDYISHGRPDATESSALFVQHRAPRAAFATSYGVIGIVKRRAAQAGLTQCGTHAIRHSVASRMINAGATLKQIADLLGHRSLRTTGIYTKVDLTSLTKVAMPWPGQEVTP